MVSSIGLQCRVSPSPGWPFRSHILLSTINYETATYIAAVVAMFGAGTVASIVAFEFDWLLGAVQYGLYFAVGIAGRWLAGIGAFPVEQSPTTTTPADTDVAMLESSIFQTFDLAQHIVLQLMQAIG